MRRFPLVEVSPAEITTLLEQVEADMSRARADQVRATLRELFADAVDEQLVARSPVPASRRAGSSSADSLETVGRFRIGFASTPQSLCLERVDDAAEPIDGWLQTAYVRGVWVAALARSIAS